MAIHDEGPSRPASGSMATASLVVGLASLVACGLGIVSGPVAVVLGIVSGRRTGFTSKEIGGIVSGALAFVATAAAMIGLFVYSARDDGAAVKDSVVTADARETPSADASPGGAVTLTQAGVAAAGFDSAYAAYLNGNQVTDTTDAISAGEAIDTPCFTLDGEAWWVVEGEPATCAPTSELRWEYVADVPRHEIKVFGSGGRGAAIAFVPLTTEKLLRVYGSIDLDVAASDARDSMLPGYGCMDIVETSITLGGVPAVQLDCTLDGYASYRVDAVILSEPYVLDDGTSISGFFIEAFNEAEWVYRSEDVFARLDNSLVWK